MNDITINSIQVGMLGVNCIVLKKEGKAVIIDPGDDADDIQEIIAEAQPVAILLTHSHYDHAGALNQLLKAYPNCEYLCHPECNSLAQSPQLNLSIFINGVPTKVAPATRTINGGETITLGGMKFRTFHVPGHSPGQLCYYIEEAQTLICGDTIFAGGIGRSDFPGGDHELLVSKIRDMLNQLPPDTRLLPGHGPSSTAAQELRSNPYL